jgi:hypothetical protein
MAARARWETAQRWYEVELVCDLLGDWVLMCNGSQWKMVVLAFNAVFGSEQLQLAEPAGSHMN